MARFASQDQHEKQQGVINHIAGLERQHLYVPTYLRHRSCSRHIIHFVLH